MSPEIYKSVMSYALRVSAQTRYVVRAAGKDTNMSCRLVCEQGCKFLFRHGVDALPRVVS